MSDDTLTPDQIRAAEKRAAAARADAGEDSKEPEERTEAPKGRRARPADTA